jgi:hypothetical protein
VPSASTLPALLRDPRGSLRRGLRRHRRPLAAALAGLATLLALTALRITPETPSAPDAGSTTASGTAIPGHVTVPVTLASGAIAAVLQVGDMIDLIGTIDGGGSIDDGPAPVSVIARGARVIDLPVGGSALGGSSSAVILVSLPEADALRVVTSMRDGLTPVIRSR